MCTSTNSASKHPSKLVKHVENVPTNSIDFASLILIVHHRDSIVYSIVCGVMEFVKLSPHDDVVHDISFDFYGRRFATCASDKRIKVWDLVEETGEWTCYDINRAHNDSIWRLSWAHPEFGQLIASCSEDKSICIWEEQESVTLLKTEQRDRWQKKVQLTDSKKSVNDVKFAPRHLGLKVAAASADGTVRIYEATDVFSLNYWQLQVNEGSAIAFYWE